jgi:hypothetical protein
VSFPFTDAAPLFYERIKKEFRMKQIIMDVLNDMSHSQVNLGSDAARKMVSTLISTALKSKGCYTEYDDSEIEEQNARETWVCSICGKNTADVDYDYIGSGTNQLGCELEIEIDNKLTIIENNSRKNPKDDADYYTGPEPADAQGRKSSYIQGSEEIDGMYTDDEVKGWEEAVGYKEPVQTLEDGGGITYREKNWLQKKHENKVFGHDMGGSYESTDTMTGHDHGKVWPGTDAIQKQIYNEMTSDGLPEGGDAQAVLESHRLADEIVDNQEGKWIYESPDGGKTVFRRPFSDYDPKNKEEIDWKTKEPTGRKFTEYNNGNWRSEDEG